MSLEEDSRLGSAEGSSWDGMSSKEVWNNAFFSTAVEARDKQLLRNILLDLDSDVLADLESHLELKSLREQNASRAMLSGWTHVFVGESALQNAANDKYSFVLSQIRNLPKK